MNRKLGSTDEVDYTVENLDVQLQPHFFSHTVISYLHTFLTLKI